MRVSRQLRNIFATLAVLIAGTGLSHAFEQGSYYVIDLVETKDAAPVAGRLAVPKAALAATAQEAPALSIEDRSEFEIDYSQSLVGTSGNSAFELNTATEPTTENESINFSTGTFDFGTSNTVFGE